MLFGLIKPNDWKIIYKAKGTYTSKYWDGSVKNPNNNWYCYLQYSKLRNKYKITSSLPYGVNDQLENTYEYQQCLDRQMQLENKEKS